MYSRTLYTGGGVGAEVGPPTGIFFYPLGNYQQFPIKWSFRRNFQTLGITLEKTFIVIVKVCNFLQKRKLLMIGIVSTKGIRKNIPDLQVVGPAPDPPTPSVFRVVLLHTEGAGKDT